MKKLIPGYATTEMKERKIWVYFYGSYINLNVLNEVNIKPVRYQIARLYGFDIDINPRANLIPNRDAFVYGILASATHQELTNLYENHAYAILGEIYLPEAVIVETMENEWRPALCYIASNMQTHLPENDYIDRIVNAAEEYKFPQWYIKKLNNFKVK